MTPLIANVTFIGSGRDVPLPAVLHGVSSNYSTPHMMTGCAAGGFPGFPRCHLPPSADFTASRNDLIVADGRERLRRGGGCRSAAGKGAP